MNFYETAGNFLLFSIVLMLAINFVYLSASFYKRHISKFFSMELRR